MPSGSHTPVRRVWRGRAIPRQNISWLETTGAKMVNTNISCWVTSTRPSVHLVGVSLFFGSLWQGKSMHWYPQVKEILYKIWDWRYDEEASQLYHHKCHVMDVYMPSLVPWYTQRPNHWTRSRIEIPLEERGEYFSVKQVGVYIAPNMCTILLCQQGSPYGNILAIPTRMHTGIPICIRQSLYV